jgi:hypothetical protein
MTNSTYGVDAVEEAGLAIVDLVRLAADVVLRLDPPRRFSALLHR